MRAVVQRVTSAAVTVDGAQMAAIGLGMVVYLGVAETDGESDVRWMADKLVHLRVFANEEGKFDRSLLQAGGEMLLISQFTLLGDARSGRRPSFHAAARRPAAEALYMLVAELAREAGAKVSLGQFGAHMHVMSDGDGPVTLLLDSTGRF